MRRVVVEVMDDAMAEIMRRKTEAERLRMAFDMCESVRGMLLNLLRSEHPDWTEDEVRREAARRAGGPGR